VSDAEAAGLWVWGFGFRVSDTLDREGCAGIAIYSQMDTDPRRGSVT
jgi:hypothetical protein